jgi:2-dehydropantoate 2-reductase
MKIAIFGAGSIGCYVGGFLASKDPSVMLFGRDRLAKIIDAHGLTLTQSASDPVHVSNVKYETKLSKLKPVDIIILTVKSQDTETACRQLSKYISKDAVIVSLQNGVSNVEQIKSVLTSQTVYGAMVPYNVMNMGEGRFHRGTGGDLVLEKGKEADFLVGKLQDAGLDAVSTADIKGVQWSKLLINLNNALNLLSDEPLVAELGQRAYRGIWSDMIEEGLRVVYKAGIKPAVMSGPDPIKLRKLIRLPNFIYKPIVKRITHIDPEARSSMWEDLRYGRSPEIDYLQGEISRLGKQYNIETPVNDRIIELVKKAFAEKKSPALSGQELRALL